MRTRSSLGCWRACLVPRRAQRSRTLRPSACSTSTSSDPFPATHRGCVPDLGLRSPGRRHQQILLLDEVHEALDHEFRLVMDECLMRSLLMRDRCGCRARSRNARAALYARAAHGAWLDSRGRADPHCAGCVCHRGDKSLNPDPCTLLTVCAEACRRSRRLVLAI